MSEKITFARRGDVKCDGIRVGWIDHIDEFKAPNWRLRFTPASGQTVGVHSWHYKLGEAKQMARQILAAKEPA